MRFAQPASHAAQIGQAVNITNCLQDPLINQRIAEIGMSLEENRRAAIDESIEGIKRGDWKKDIKSEDELTSFHAIKLFLSFSLEPQIPGSTKQRFQQVFRDHLPREYEQGQALLWVIKTGRFDTPEKYKRTALECYLCLGINPRYVIWGEPFIVFDRDARKKWADEHDVPEDSWE